MRLKTGNEQAAKQVPKPWKQWMQRERLLGKQYPKRVLVS